MQETASASEPRGFVVISQALKTADCRATPQDSATMSHPAPPSQHSDTTAGGDGRDLPMEVMKKIPLAILWRISLILHNLPFFKSISRNAAPEVLREEIEERPRGASDARALSPR